MLGLSIRTLLLSLFGLLVGIVGGQGYLATSKIAAVNDSVVVSDRIRENLRKFKRMDLTELLNVSINETLSRTILTGMTAIAGILALLIFGGEVIRNFSFAMLFGILIGTYSSIFIAAPLLGYLGVKRETVGGAPKVEASPVIAPPTTPSTSSAGSASETAPRWPSGPRRTASPDAKAPTGHPSVSGEWSVVSGQ